MFLFCWALPQSTHPKMTNKTKTKNKNCVNTVYKKDINIRTKWHQFTANTSTGRTTSLIDKDSYYCKYSTLSTNKKSLYSTTLTQIQFKNVDTKQHITHSHTHIQWMADDRASHTKKYTNSHIKKNQPPQKRFLPFIHFILYLLLVIS